MSFILKKNNSFTVCCMRRYRKSSKRRRAVHGQRDLTLGYDASQRHQIAPCRAPCAETVLGARTLRAVLPLGQRPRRRHLERRHQIAPCRAPCAETVLGARTLRSVLPRGQRPRLLRRRPMRRRTMGWPTLHRNQSRSPVVSLLGTEPASTASLSRKKSGGLAGTGSRSSPWSRETRDGQVSSTSKRRG